MTISVPTLRAGAAALALALALAAGCREARSPGPSRRPVAEREYREVEALEWTLLPGESEIARYLGSQWPKVRRRAVVAFGRAHGGGNPRLLLERWRVEDDPGTRAEIVFALRRFDRSSVLGVLERASEDDDAVVRGAVATALRDVPESRALAEKLAQDEDPSVRRRAVLSLAFGGQADAGFWSRRLAEERHQEVRWALYAGAAHEPRLAPTALTSATISPSGPAADLAGAVADRNFLVGVFALHVLDRLDLARDDAAPESSRELAAILDIAGSPDAFWIHREAAVRSLARRLLGNPTDDDRRAIESRLLELAGGESFPREPPALRQRLVRALCAVRDPAVAPRLRELAVGSDPRLRLSVAEGIADVFAPSAAVRSLAPDRELGGPRPDLSLRKMVDELRIDSEESVRAAAARVADPDGRPAAWALADPSPRVRAAALEAPVAVLSSPVVEAALRDPDARVRRVALDRAREDDLQVDAGVLRSVATDPAAWRWSARLEAMDLLCSRHPAESRDVLESALQDADPVIVRHALAIARRLTIDDLSVPDDLSVRAAMVPGFPLVDHDPTREQRRPRVVIGVEGKESFVLELYAEEAPLHVSSFLALARAGYYTAREVSRVDVAGGVRLHGYEEDRHPLVGQPLRREGSLLPFVRGSLVSVPVYSRHGEAWDAAGAWQITLLPRPDLRERGTCWGQVLIGMHVVDRLAPGDRLASIEIVD